MVAIKQCNIIASWGPKLKNFLPTLGMKLQHRICPFLVIRFCGEDTMPYAVLVYHGISPGFTVHYHYLEH